MPFFFSKPEPQPIVLDDDDMDDLLNSKKPSKYASLMKPPTNPQCPPCPPCTRGGKQRRKTKSRRTRSKKRGGKKSRRRV